MLTPFRSISLFSAHTTTIYATDQFHVQERKFIATIYFFFDLSAFSNLFFKVYISKKKEQEYISFSTYLSFFSLCLKSSPNKIWFQWQRNSFSFKTSLILKQGSSWLVRINLMRFLPNEYTLEFKPTEAKAVCGCVGGWSFSCCLPHSDWPRPPLLMHRPTLG